MKTVFSRLFKRLGVFTPIVMIALIISIVGSACVLDQPPEKFWVGSIVRDLKTKGKDAHVEYVQEGSTTESQVMTFFTQGGTFSQAQVTYGKAGQAATEQLSYKLPNGSMSQRFTQEAWTSNENLMDIVKSKLTWQTIEATKPGEVFGVPYQVAKNENKFLYPGILPGQENFKVEAYCQMKKDEQGYPDIPNSNYWYAAIYGDTLLGTGFRPNYTVLEGGTNTYNVLPCDWANRNEAFDTALFLTREGVFDSLNENKWQSIDPKYGKVRLSIYNPLGIGELVGFQTPVYGFAIDNAGKRVDYRILPIYEPLDSTLYYGPAKANTPDWGSTLRQLLIQVKVGNTNTDDSYKTVAGWFFLKGRFAANGLYAFKVFKPGEDPKVLIEQLKTEMDRDIPQDIAALLYNPIEGDPNTQEFKDQKAAAMGKVVRWMASRDPFDLSVVREKYGLEVLAVVTYADIGDRIVVYEPCGTDEHPAACPRVITTTPRTQLVWDISYNHEHGIDNVNYWTTFMGEPAMNAFSMDFVGKGKGDGTGIIFAGMQLMDHIKNGNIGYPDAIRLDMRSASWPENIDPAMHAIFGAWMEYWK